jgi:hypothetical protein
LSDRKYRHQGYQDSGPRQPRSDSVPRPEPPKPRVEGAPRGRSAGAPGPAVFKCNRCSAVQRTTDGVPFEAGCSNCGADLHACTNCRFFDTMTQWECRETIPARVAPKDTANQCELFSPRIIRDLTADKGSAQPPSSGKLSSADEARAAFEKLFKK